MSPRDTQAGERRPRRRADHRGDTRQGPCATGVSRAIQNAFGFHTRGWPAASSLYVTAQRTLPPFACARPEYQGQSRSTDLIRTAPSTFASLVWSPMAMVPFIVKLFRVSFATPSMLTVATFAASTASS